MANDGLPEATRRLAAAGCVAPREEAQELAVAAEAMRQVLSTLVTRRTTGEPLAWITGTVQFCGCSVTISPGVFVPRWHSEQLAVRAAELLPPRGRAIDLGTGSGAVARVLLDRNPAASVIGTERDPVAAACARRNGVTVVEGDLFGAVPVSWMGRVDVVAAILPYVPTAEIAYLARDVRDYEPRSALDGGQDGLEFVRRAVAQASDWLGHGGHLLLEIGGDQAKSLAPDLERAGLTVVQVLFDEDGDPRGLEAVAPSARKGGH
ncbi:MAG TPA: HemK/PrmC family methyltransferase [Candidatus Dormibacteraeota bacterium]|nr:HemK/PrmC family methyltransferase [Candidatus Dormibacteraeota bacterium]